MSPPAPNPSPEQAQAANQIAPYVKDGVIAFVLGGFSMAARVLMSTEPVSFGYVVRRFIAASITAAFVGMATKDYFTSTGLWLGVCGGAGYAAPEVTDFLIKWVKAKGNKELADVEAPNKRKKPRPKKRK
jgi:hypothetical protein